MARRGAFKDDDLDDIDDLLPPSPPAPVVAVPVPQVANQDTAVTPQPRAGDVPAGATKTPRKASSPKVGAEAPAKRARTAPVRARAAQSIAEAHVGARVAQALRQLTHGEKQQRGRGRSYGEVVLDAIEQFETELRQHFEQQAGAVPAGRLFRRVDQTRPRRRRHTEPPVKIPLAGIIAPDVELLDNLVIEWQAGSRSALVEEALKLYLAQEIAQLSDEESDDEAEEPVEQH
ncbi:hypothetical protein [Nocardia tengchongensis]|uniref:hypothetical protein n=1 Tax=Nocardia tengchongensis TaxID=2055889 RepID=UPI0036A854C7